MARSASQTGPKLAFEGRTRRLSSAWLVRMRRGWAGRRKVSAHGILSSRQPAVAIGSFKGRGDWARTTWGDEAAFDHEYQGDMDALLLKGERQSLPVSEVERKKKMNGLQK